jgi:hypothetical protein
MEAFNKTDLAIAMTSIRTQNGLVARLATFHHKPHLHSEIERAKLSTLADITSLALSGRVTSARGQ